MASFYENDSEPDVQEVDTTDVTNEVQTTQDVVNKGDAKKIASKKTTRFGTVHTLNTSSDDDEEEGQAFYAGGSEHSGQQVLGPPKRDIVADMFKSVKEQVR